MKKRLVGLVLVIILAFLILQLDFSGTLAGSYEYYVSNWSDVEVPNLVTAILADWRVYDSMGEAIILFAAISGAHLISEVRKK